MSAFEINSNGARVALVNQWNACFGSRPCENDFGPPKSPSDGPMIAEDGRTEQFFPAAL